MKHSENIRTLFQSLNTFSAAYHALLNEIYKYEQDTNMDINDLPGFLENYPFHVSLDNLSIDQWIETIVDIYKQKAFKILNYEYLNTGGNCMVGIFTVWIPKLKQTIYALTNEEGCNLSVVDYISNELDIDDYDELLIDHCVYDFLKDDDEYFELYRYCLNEYTKSECRYFGCTRAIPYRLLSNELQSKVDADYLVWLEQHNYDVLTDGEIITVHPDYDMLFTDPHEDDADLQAVKEFYNYHDQLVNGSTMDEVERLYDKKYRLSFNGKRIYIPFNADTYSQIDDLLKTVIKEW